MNNEVLFLKNELKELKGQIAELSLLMTTHIKSESDLLEAWNGFNWTKKTAIQIITMIGGVIAILWGVLQILEKIR